MKPENQAIDTALQGADEAVLNEWLAEVGAAAEQTRNAASAQWRAEASGLLDAVRAGVRADGDAAGFNGPAWDKARSLLDSLSRSRAAQGVTAAETSTFLLALKKPIFARVQDRLIDDPKLLVSTLWAASTLVDRVAAHAAGVHQRSREDIISRQQEELLELSTPVVKLWEGVLAAPMIGTLDSSRTQLVMEALLQRIVETGSELAIIDITGVPTVDTLVAQHLLKTVTAIRLMGADCIISGIRPQIAQTIVHLGIDLQGITTKASLADALALAMKRSGYTVTRAAR